MTPAYAVAIVNYDSYEDLDRCIASLYRQASKPGAVVVADQGPMNRELASSLAVDPEVIWAPGPNRGFAAGANRGLAEAAQAVAGAAFLLLLNADIELEGGFAELSIVINSNPP